METTVPFLISATAIVLLCLGAILDDRRARVRRRGQRDEPALALPLLHSINDDRCIGCEACIDVCPTEVLDLVEHKVRVSRFSDCVQCEQCANACPTQALVMYREGTTPRMLTVPELDEHFQTGVPGQYLIGEVAGKPLVKNAANLGRAVIEHIARELANQPAAGRHAGDAKQVLDVLIVGSGPGGLSAGLSCVKHKLSCLVLEKEHVISSTVSRYPKGKHFMAEPCTSQNVSYLPVFNGTKEELVAAWTQVIEGVKLPIKLGEAVETVKRGDDGVFTIKSTVGTYRARNVVLATGLRGKPRLLVVPGANLEKVQPLLDDPAEFAGEAVLVVGGGDSAVEGAMALAEVGATVTLSYRGDGFKRCKQGNQKRLAEMVADRRVTMLLESNVKCFTPDSVTITLADKSETTIANHRAFVLIGADTPVAWLETNNVRFVERPHLYALGSSEDVVRRLAPDAAECPRTPDDALAILLDRPPPARRVRSVVDHLRDEIREVVTSVSSAFRLTDLEPPREVRRPATRTQAHVVALARDRSQVIPASRLAARRPATAPVPEGGSMAPSIERERPATTAAPLLPRSPQRRANANVDVGPALRSAAPDRDVATAATTSRPTRKRAPTRYRPEDVITAEVSSLPARDREAFQTAALRCADGGMTEEITSLDALEQQARQLAALRRADNEPAVVSAALELLDNPTEVELPSLRALERATEVELPSLRALENPTEVELPSLRALERATEVEVPSLRALERSAVAAASPQTDRLEADAHPPIPPVHIELARSSQTMSVVDGAPPRRAITASIAASAARSPTPARPDVTPPPRASATPPPRAGATPPPRAGATPPPRAGAMPPPRASATPPPRASATPPRASAYPPPPPPPRSSRPGATPPPLPPQVARGSRAIASQRPAPTTPELTSVASNLEPSTTAVGDARLSP